MLKRVSELTADHLDRNVLGYDVLGSDGEQLGKVEDILVDADTREEMFLLVDTGFWIFGRKVMVPITSVGLDDANERLTIPWDREFLRDLPEYSPEMADVEESEGGTVFDRELPYIWKDSMPGSNPMTDYFGPETPSRSMKPGVRKDKHDLEIKHRGD